MTDAWDAWDGDVVPPAGETGGDEAGPCPVTAIGHIDGSFWFLDVVGQPRSLSARQLGSRSEIISLFLGDSSWLMAAFPRRMIRRKTVAGQTVEEEVVTGIDLAKAGDSLQMACRHAGLYGPHVKFRRSGVWAGDVGAPVVHAGDEVLLGGAVLPAGTRTGSTVWAACPRTPRPGAPCGPEIGLWLRDTIAELWRFRQAGSELIVLGLLGVGYLGAAARWRSNGFLIGRAGSGKSQLLHLIRAAAPLHSYTNDTTKAGIESAAGGRAMPIYIDEASDRVDQTGAQNLMDMVLAATGGDGVQGLRGTSDGAGRSIEMVGAVVMAAVSPPTMQAQHLARFTIVDLVKPDAGEDNLEAMTAAIARAREIGPALWGRMLRGWSQWISALASFRDALGRCGCAAREMDQIGAILASWWVLTHDGVPTANEALDGVHGVRDYVRPASDVAQEDAPRQCVQHLLSMRVQRTHTTDMVPIGELLEMVFAPSFETQHVDAAHHLERHGIRPVRWDEPPKNRGPAPRMAEGDGVWFSTTSAPLKALFKNTPFEGARWRYAMLGLESARASLRTVRISGSAGHAIWVSYVDLHGDDL